MLLLWISCKSDILLFDSITLCLGNYIFVILEISMTRLTANCRHSPIGGQYLATVKRFSKAPLSAYFGCSIRASFSHGATCILCHFNLPAFKYVKILLFIYLFISVSFDCQRVFFTPKKIENAVITRRPTGGVQTQWKTPHTLKIHVRNGTVIKMIEGFMNNRSQRTFLSGTDS